MNYKGKYSLKQNLVEGRGFGLLSEMTKEEESWIEDNFGLDLSSDGKELTDLESGETIAMVESRRRFKKTLTEGIDWSGKSVGDEFGYGAFKLKVKSVADDGTPTSVDVIHPNGTVVATKSNMNSARSSARPRWGNFIEQGVADAVGGDKIGGPNNPDVSNVEMAGGAVVHAECGGQGKPSQMGNCPGGITEPTGHKLHHSRRAAIGLPKASAAWAAGQSDPGGDPCAKGDPLSVDQVYDFWMASVDSGVPADQQESLIIAGFDEGFKVFALKEGLGNLASHPNINIPVLTKAACKACKLQLQGSDGKDRPAPVFNQSLDWDKASDFIPYV